MEHPSKSPTLSDISSHVLHVSGKTNWWFLSVTDSTGAIGWGEGSLNGWEPALDALTAQQRPSWLGLPIELAVQEAQAWPGPVSGLLGAAVASAFLQALLSLQAQHAGQAPYALLGPAQRERLPLYANINRATVERSPDGFAATARRAQAQGFERFKAAPFDGLIPALCNSAEGRARIRHGIDCLLAIRDAIGPQAELMVDCHWRFDEERALQALRDLQPVGLRWFECPLPETHANWNAIRRIRRAANAMGVQLAAAETQVGLAAFQTLFDEGLYDVVMPDVKYCGGPWEMLRIAQRAAEQGVGFSPHNPTGPVCTWQSLQVGLVAPVCDMLELQFDESALTDMVSLGVDLQARQGALTQPAAQASVQHLDAAVLAAHPFRPVPPGIESQLNR
ncbi:MAG: enolase C-terminal domain-like protein [Betaproteobacteria bacterium]